MNRIRLMEKERIGLFGGTFNPVHSGHLKAAVAVQKKFALDKLLFIPSFIPPHKESSEIASPLHRLRMIELAVAAFPRLVPSPIEIEAKGKSYSIITLNTIKKLYTNARIFFILGIDAFLEIETWKDYEKVLEKCFLIVISRPGYRLEEAKNVLEGIYRAAMHRLSGLDMVKEEDLLSYKIFLFPLAALDVASKEIREKISKGRSIKGMVPEDVRVYIMENKLYQRV